MQDEPRDPFSDDEPDHEPGDDELAAEPLSETERAEIIEDLTSLEVYQSLLEPTGVRGLVIECPDCREPHYFEWGLLRSNLRHLLESNRPRLHEPAYDPDPSQYVSWDYARGYTDGVQDAHSSLDE